MKFINLTPHDIVMNDGTVYAKSGMIARISSTYTKFDDDGITTITYGDPIGLPAPQDGVRYIVSAIVASAVKRSDLVCPATGHPDCIRDDRGFIVSVPGFVRT